MSLAVVDVDAITSPDDRFKCVPYSATIRAELCTNRQREQRFMQTHFRIGNKVKERGEGKVHAYVSKCRDCELGRRVAARLGAEDLLAPLRPPPQPALEVDDELAP